MVSGSLQTDDLAIGIEPVDAREDNRLSFKRYLGKLAGILEWQDQIAYDLTANLIKQLDRLRSLFS